MSENFDVAIVGGGLVGMSLAAALDGSGLSVLLIEASPEPASVLESWDERHFAVARASVQRLQELNAFPVEAQSFLIREVHVSRVGEFGRILLRATDQQLEAFGATVPARLLSQALFQRLQSAVNVKHLRSARLNHFIATEEYVRLQLEVNGIAHYVNSKLLVAADGSESAIRTALGIPVQHYDYEQTAIVCSALCSEPHHGRAFERFTDDGPVALLPLSDHRCGVVCTFSAADAAAAMAMDNLRFMQLLQERFGYRLGPFTRIGRRQAWPLRLVAAERVIDQRTVIIGNAAQTIHPIGAQGFNLGLRDASELATQVRISLADPGNSISLDRYARIRQSDREQTIRISDSILRIGSSQLKILRGAVMSAVDRLPLLKRALATSAMGYRAGVNESF